MVAAKDEEVFGVFDLVGEEQADGLEALLASVHVVTQEQVIRIRREAPVLEQAQQIIILTVNVT